MKLAPLVLLFAFCASGAEPDRSWQHYGGDAGGRRYSPHAEITVENVHRLRRAWTYRTGDVSGTDRYPGTSSFKATPIVFDDRLYLSTPFNRVIALNAARGELLWSFDPEIDFSDGFAEMYTSRGVSLWVGPEPGESCGARIILGTLDARLIALDANTGEPCSEFGERGEVDLSVGIRNFRPGEYSVTSPPAVIGNLIVVGSAVGDNGAVALDHGDVRAFDARTGKRVWSWDPIPRRRGMEGHDTWSRRGAARTGAANAWSIISADPARGLVFVPTTSPSPDFFGGVRKGDNLFANSVVALDAVSGERVWHFQTVHHDLWDYDVASQPVLASIAREGRQVPAVLQATKMGHVFVLDRDTGRPLYPVEERAVPQTDVPGEQTSPTQPFPVAPPPLHPARASSDDIWALSDEHERYCREQFDRYRHDGIFTPPSTEGTIVYPGNPGGVNWGSMAVHEAEQIAVTINERWPTIVTLIPRAEFRRRAEREEGGPLGVQFTAQRGTPYGMMRHSFVNPANGAPCLRGPWGMLVALNVDDGTVRWQVPIGTMPGLEDHPDASRWGTIPSGGPIVTNGGLVFAATDDEPALFAFSLDSGETLHRLDLPAGAQATPMSYRAAGKQFVVVVAGGNDTVSGRRGDYVLAFALEEPSSPAAR